MKILEIWVDRVDPARSIPQYLSSLTVLLFEREETIERTIPRPTNPNHPVWLPNEGIAKGFVVDIYDNGGHRGHKRLKIPSEKLEWTQADKEDCEYYLGRFDPKLFLERTIDWHLHKSPLTWIIRAAELSVLNSWLLATAPEITKSYIELEPFGGPA